MTGALGRQAAVVVLVTLAIVGGARRARAESTLVILVRRSAGEPAAAEFLQRARGELLADGFDVRFVEPMSRADRVEALARVGRATGAAVTAGLFVEDDLDTIEIELVGGLSSRVLTRRIEVPANSAERHQPEVLARRAVDLLRASLLEFLVASLRTAVSEGSTPPPIAPPGNSEAKSHSAWAIEAGLGMLGSYQGIAPAIVPLGRIRYALDETFQLRATGAWLGTQPRVDAPGGSATVEQGIAVVECVARLWRGPSLRPAVSLGAGGYYVAVNGSGAPPHRGQRSSDFVFALDAGVGLAAAIASHLELVLEGHALLTEPGVAVRVLDSDVARIGRPSFLGALSLAGWIGGAP